MIMKLRNPVAHQIMWCHNPTDHNRFYHEDGGRIFIWNNGPHIQANRV